MVLLEFEEVSAPSRSFDLIVHYPFDLLHQETRWRHVQRDVAYAHAPGMFPVWIPAWAAASCHR